MLGWNMNVFRQTGDGHAPAQVDSEEGERLAVWQTGAGGLEWIIDLVKAEQAIDLGGDGHKRDDKRPTVHVAVFTRDGRRIVSGGHEGFVVWEADSGNVVSRLACGGNANDVATLPDGRRVLGCSSDKMLRLWDLETGRLLKEDVGANSIVGGIALNADGRLAVSTEDAAALRVWDVDTGRQLMESHTRAQRVALSRGGGSVFAVKSSYGLFGSPARCHECGTPVKDAVRPHLRRQQSGESVSGKACRKAEQDIA